MMDYAQARMQARFGRRPDPGQWAALARQAGLDDLLAAVRGTSLAGSVEGLSASAGPHLIERAMRRYWRTRCAELAGWLPQPWRLAVRSTGELIDLPVQAHLARGQPVPDGLTAELAGRGQPLADLSRATRADWLADWQRRWPETSGEQGRQLREFVTRVEYHLVDSVATRTPAPLAQQSLAAMAQRRFRRWAGEPIAAFAYLLLLALDLGRLRAELLSRSLARRGGS